MTHGTVKTHGPFMARNMHINFRKKSLVTQVRVYQNIFTSNMAALLDYKRDALSKELNSC